LDFVATVIAAGVAAYAAVAIWYVAR
jgi:uncharacterized membrane protein